MYFAALKFLLCNLTCTVVINQARGAERVPSSHTQTVWLFELQGYGIL